MFGYGVHMPTFSAIGSSHAAASVPTTLDEALRLLVGIHTDDAGSGYHTLLGATPGSGDIAAYKAAWGLVRDYLGLL